VEVREARPEEWDRLRVTRLAALADSPFAFGSSLASEGDRPEAYWRDRLDRRGEDGATFAVADDEAKSWYGLAAVYVDPADRTAWLVSMWVDPQVRRRGFGGRLIDAAVSWAAHRGVDELRLWVTETNHPAIELYREHGFEPAGGRQPLPSDPTLTEFEMRRPLP
jgi:GNAT superfamily N-acetyltransferase